MRFLRHLRNLLGQIAGYAWQHKAWWIIPLAFLLLLLVFVISTSQAAAPFIYTLF